MVELKISIFGHSAQRDMARWLVEQASVALVYLGIVAAFAAVSLIGCVIWLLIWWKVFGKRSERGMVVKRWHQSGDK